MEGGSEDGVASERDLPALSEGLRPKGTDLGLQVRQSSSTLIILEKRGRLRTVAVPLLPRPCDLGRAIGFSLRGRCQVRHQGKSLVLPLSEVLQTRPSRNTWGHQEPAPAVLCRYS